MDATMSTAAPKRPYVRPRVGNSMVRSLGYVLALLLILVIALLLPRSPDRPERLEGSWQFRPQTASGPLPPGDLLLIVTDDHYALHTESGSGEGPRVGMEMGDIVLREGTAWLAPRQGIYQLAEGIWSRALPAGRDLSLHREGARLMLRDGAGNVIATGSRAPLAAPRPVGSVPVEPEALD
jgi:hypothetical protein